MLVRSRVRKKGWLTSWLETKAGLIFPGHGGLYVPKSQNVLAVLGTPRGKILIPGANTVTNDGDLHYAQRGANEAPTNFTTGAHLMATAGTPSKTANLSNFTQIAASEKNTEAGYPQTNDADGDNTGAGVDIVTWLVSYTAGDFNSTGISHGVITNPTPGASEVLLTGYAFAASFDKTASDTLKVFANHEMSGQ